MMAPELKSKTLAGTIFRDVLIFSVTIVMVLLVCASLLSYWAMEREAEGRLMSEAEAAAEIMNSSDGESGLSEYQFAGPIRYTLIDSDGSVIMDTEADPSSLENHSDRPEVVEAAKNGYATSTRYSETLGIDTVYAAIELDNGDVLRLSEDRTSAFSFIRQMVVPIGVILVVVIFLAYVVARRITEHIMHPIDALNFTDVLENDIYKEMMPLLERIDEQQTQLKEQNIELARAENLRREFSANVSHEMKTPLQVISGYAELMKNDMVQPADRQKFATLIYEEAQAMRSLINDVLTISRLDEIGIHGNDMERIDLYRLAEVVASRLEAVAKGDGIEIEVTGGSAFILGAPTLAEEMVYNLVENGVRYNRPGGKVTVDVRDTGHGVELRVSDTGPGIPDEYKDKVFERFFRLEKSRSKATGGTGLGLAIVKHAVQFHGGMISVESEMGKGTTFVMKLPRAVQGTVKG